jgi:hypothetical protein
LLACSSDSFPRQLLKILKLNHFILPVLYGFKIWSLALREENILSGLENGVLRTIFEANRDEVTDGWRKLHNEALRNLNFYEILFGPSYRGR